MTETIEAVIAKLAALPPEALAQIEAQVGEGLKGVKWVPNPGPQTDAYFSMADILLYGGAGGGGKGVRKSQPVLTPFGWRQIGDLKVGSALCATDGTVQHIIARYDRGRQPLYKLTWADGRETVCDEDHIWLMWPANKSHKIAGNRTSGETSAKKWTTRQIWEHYQRPVRRKERLAIPVISAPCAFNVQGENKGSRKHIGRTTPPYVLGVLLGDGSLGKDVTFCSADPEIPDRVEYLLAGSEQRMSRYGAGVRCPVFRISKGVISENLADLGVLGCRAAEKFIPRIYLFSTVGERWELLRGLMDTDGWVEEDGDCYFCSVSKRLADDVEHLARSLGAVTSRRERTPRFSYRGERRVGQRAHTVRIKMREPERMFNLERKAERCRGKEPQTMGLWLDKIEQAGTDETICITASHPNSLFITEHFVVTHNTGLIIGLGLTAHQRSLIMRRHFNDLGALIEDCLRFNGTRDGFTNSIPPTLRTADHRFLEFGGMAKPGDELNWMGRPHDFFGADEAAHFPEKQIRFLMGWVRTTDPRQRCRVVLATNPPLSSDGEWLIRMFSPWLDRTHKNPAKPGELRWFVTDERGQDKEVPGPDPVEVEGKLVTPLSRTFIPAALKDNPFLSRGDYAAKLDAMQEPFRSAIRDGNFMAARADHERQVIPSGWVRSAQLRWQPTPPLGVPMCAIGVDVAAGGPNDTVLAMRHDGWFAPLVSVQGKDTPTGATVAGLVTSHRRDGAMVVIDMGGGYGGGPLEHLRNNGVEVVPFKGAAATKARSGDRQFGFYNRRAEAYWRFREALDPGQPGGSRVALPDDSILAADLAAPIFEVGPRGIKIEAKDDIVARLGRSPDRGDAVVMAWSAGAKNVSPDQRTSRAPTRRVEVQTRRSMREVQPRRFGREQR